MFIEVTNMDGDIELINPAYVTKLMSKGGSTRINISDGSYVRTRENIDDLWAKLEGEE